MDRVIRTACICALGIAICTFGLTILNIVDSNLRCNEIETELINQIKARDYKIEQLEKEIRLLKTDINILENGFPE